VPWHPKAAQGVPTRVTGALVGLALPTERIRRKPLSDSARESGGRVQELVVQATNNTKAQFANSPTLSTEIMNAVMDALAAHNTMSKQALDSEKVRDGLKDVLLGRLNSMRRSERRVS
jgi:hypothetical protein